MDETLKKIMEILQNTAPHVWEVLVRQVYVEAVFKLAWAFGFFIVGMWLSNYMKKSQDELDDDLKAIINIILIALALLSFGFFVSGIMWMINPEFYAIKWLLFKVTGN